MIKHRTVAFSALAMMLVGPSSMLHAESGSSSVRLFEFKPFQGNPLGILARSQPKTNSRAPGSITNIKPDADAARNPAGAMTKDGVVNDTRRDFGSFGIPYTTTRVQEGVRGADAGDAIVSARPIPTAPLDCSAAPILAAFARQVSFAGESC